MSVKDELASLRLDCLDGLIEGLKYNKKYSADFTILKQWVVILLNRN